MQQILNVPFKTDDYYSDTAIKSEDFIAELGEFEWLIYSYGTAPYCGSGDMIWKKKDLYYHHDMGHCSCYGWENNMNQEEGFSSLEELLKNSSEEINENMNPLIEKMREAGLS